MKTLKFQELSLDDFVCTAFIPADMGLAEIHGETNNFEIVIDLTNYDVILKEKKKVKVDEEGNLLEKPEIVEIERKVNLRDWYEKKYTPTSEWLRGVLEILPIDFIDFDIGLKPAGEFFEVLKDFFTDLYEAYRGNKEIEELGYNTLLNFMNFCKNYEAEMEKKM